MLLWFAGCSMLAVWQVFRDPAIDYRLVMAGSLLPDAVDVVLGGPRLLHTLVASAALLGAVMLGTRRRRGTRRRLLAVPIGTFLHLVLDAMWARTEVFWWPAIGLSFSDDVLPSLSRPALLIVGQEVLGALALLWWWRRFRLDHAEQRRHIARTGRVTA